MIKGVAGRVIGVVWVQIVIWRADVVKGERSRGRESIVHYPDEKLGFLGEISLIEIQPVAS